VNATIFNSPIAQACSWNPSLVEEMARAIAKESLALGANQLFAPLADIARELRHGRVEEMYGEDGFLVGEFAHAYVVGVQDTGVSAMVKHFAAFGTTEQGLNVGPVHGGERELRTTYLPSYKRAIVDGNAFSIMTAYHSYDGVPAVADPHLLTDILRDEWKYKYFTMTDAGASDRLCNSFRMCESNPIDKEAVVKYILPAGGDVEMGGGSYSFETIPELVKAKKISLDEVDTAVSRILRAKFSLGLFENPYPNLPESKVPSAIHTKAHIALSQKLDEESIVLLENHNNVLPLSPTASIAVIGPMAHGFMNYGDYVVWNASQSGVTPYDGILAASQGGKVTYAQGCERWSTSQSGFPAAIAAAEQADVAVVVVGTWSRDQNELWMGLNATTGEHVDVDSLDLVGAQEELVRAIINTGKPTVVVFSSGKPVTAPWISTAAAALVQQFYPGEQGGAALANVLFGKVNPSGKLSVSFPHSVGALPVHYDYLNSGRDIGDVGQVFDNGTLVFGHQYVLGDPRPLYEFGYGLSYSTFEYGAVSVDKTDVKATDTVTVSVTVKNNSKRDGQEVVQLYVKDLVASVVVPNIQLKGFNKVSLKAGESKKVQIKVKMQDLGLWNARMKYVVEPGQFQFLVGSSSQDFRGNVTVTLK
jgi:beta-glucosidase